MPHRFALTMSITAVFGGAMISGLALRGHPSRNGFVAGEVRGANAPISGSTVTLWAAGPGAPRQLAHPGAGPNDAIALLAVLGVDHPEHVIVDEFTTVASVWTGAQFLEAGALRGHSLGLKIAAGNVASFVNLETGSYGFAIQDPLNSGQTPTMANFATLADVLAGCVTKVRDDACAKLYAAATPPQGVGPRNTLEAAEAIARYSWYKHGGRYLWRRRGCPGQCLVHVVRRQIHRDIRQEREATYAANWHHIRR